MDMPMDTREVAVDVCHIDGGYLSFGDYPQLFSGGAKNWNSTPL